MRGLKLLAREYLKMGVESHLLQMRGLKLAGNKLLASSENVASFTDAWIETKLNLSFFSQPSSHLLQMRGLKQRYKEVSYHQFQSHLLQMRGLKH